MPALRGKFVLAPIGAVLLVRFIEVVRISESPFREVPLYIISIHPCWHLQLSM